MSTDVINLLGRAVIDCMAGKEYKGLVERVMELKNVKKPKENLWGILL